MSAFRSKISLFSGAVALSLLASTATATPISLVYNGSSVPTQSNWESVKIDAAPVTVAGSGNVYAFGFNMTETTTPTSPLGSFLAWCLDLGSYLAPAGAERDYTITDTPFSKTYTLDLDQQARVQSVFDANFGTLDVTDGVEAAGFQVALWNAVYDADKYAGEGDFSASNSVSALADGVDIIAKANFYLGKAETYRLNEGDKAYRMTFLESTPGDGEVKHQNLVTVSPVPLPAAGILLLAALGGLGFAGRRRKAA